MGLGVGGPYASSLIEALEQLNIDPRCLADGSIRAKAKLFFSRTSRIVAVEYLTSIF